MKADLETYKQLVKLTSKPQETVWYGLSYKLFSKQPLETMDDFWRLVAAAYSWMPTIPEIYKEAVKPGLIGRLKKLKATKNIDDKTLQALFIELIPVINNSLIGTSKVLHFINPNLVPIIDSNVIHGWNSFFKGKEKQYDLKRLPYYKTALNQNHVKRYMLYWQALLEWKQTCGKQVSLREIETALFDLGRKKLKQQEKN